MKNRVLRLLICVLVTVAAGLAAAACGLWAEGEMLYIAYYATAYAFVPVCACVTAYLAAKTGIPGLLSWLPGPAACFIVYRAFTGMMFPGVACALTAVLAIVGASAGEVKYKRSK